MNNWEYAESIESEKIVKIEKKYPYCLLPMKKEMLKMEPLKKY